ncbi:TraU family protein [Chlamydiales bacterium]|nr:TraU family protein [Chlamydiales bacterium]
MRCIYHLIVIFLLFIAPLLANNGKVINPITDICWECIFPIKVAGVNVTPESKDASHSNKKVCSCAGTPPKIGIPLSFWEPSYIVDVTRHPYRLIGMGGISVGKETLKNRGSVGTTNGSSTNTSFLYSHVYRYPILQILGIFTDFSCLSDEKEISIPFFSEFVPTWNDEKLSLILSPEAAFFSNEAAQLACISDCISTSISLPIDALFWCAGCEGSLYPFSGSVAHHVGAVQSSSLILQRAIALMHRSNLMKGFESDNFCNPTYMPLIKKSLYKTQLVFPIAQTSGECHPIGKSDVIWGSAKSFPVEGEDFAYLLWTKRQCCLDAVKPALKVGGGV